MEKEEEDHGIDILEREVQEEDLQEILTQEIDILALVLEIEVLIENTEMTIEIDPGRDLEKGIEIQGISEIQEI